MSYFKEEKINQDDRRNTAFQAVNAIREAVTVAKKSHQSITYEHALDLVHDLKPELYTEITELLSNKNESDTVKFYKEMADAKSTDDKKVNPLDLLANDIDEIDELLKKDRSKRSLQKRLFDLKAAVEYFTPREVSEHKILNHDFYLAQREGYFQKPLYENDSYKDYKVGDNSILRLRLLHPDKAEAIIGADLVYEQFDLVEEKVRFIHLQYKVWGNNNAIYFSEGNMVAQLEKLENNLCNSGYCNNESGSKYSNLFRFPHCSGFLRPTSKIMDSQSKLVSTGLHVPVCTVMNLKDEENKVSKDNIAGKCISNKIFEELFNTNLIGSRWMKITELEEFYKEKGINSSLDTIRVHAQHVLIKSQERKE